MAELRQAIAQLFSRHRWKNLAYATHSPSQTLDLYLPFRGEPPFPVVVWVHGGGWFSGDKSLSSKALPLRLLQHGYAIASVGYRLSGEAHFPCQIQDVKMAVRWLRTQSERYHLDPNHIGAWGESAGGHLVALLGTTAHIPEFEGLELDSPNVSSQVQAVVDWFGPTDVLKMDEQATLNGCEPFDGTGHNSSQSPESRLIGVPITARPDLARAINPITYVNSHCPPFLIQHSKEDCVVPWQQSQLLYDALTAAIAPEFVTLDFIPDAGHGGQLFAEASNFRRVLQFLTQHLKP